MSRKNQKIVRSDLFGEVELSMLECDSKQCLPRFYVIKQVFFDECGKKSRIVIDYCDTYIDAMFHYRSTFNSLFDRYLNLV